MTSSDKTEQPIGQPLALSLSGNSEGAEILSFSKLKFLKLNSDDSDNFEPENLMSFNTKFAIGAALTIGGFVCVILIGIAMVKIKNRRSQPEIVEV